MQCLCRARPEIWWFVFLQVHIDDLSRNFALNQGNGIKVKAFYRWVVLPLTAVAVLCETLLRLSLNSCPCGT